MDSGFKGADGAAASSSGGKPVQFEREKEGDKDDVSDVADDMHQLRWRCECRALLRYNPV